jgi:hypothetical protein
VKKGHWFGAVVILLVGYLIGVFYPGPGQKLKSKVSGAAGA